jgi:hypothetical protein
MTSTIITIATFAVLGALHLWAIRVAWTPRETIQERQSYWLTKNRLPLSMFENTLCDGVAQVVERLENEKQRRNHAIGEAVAARQSEYRQLTERSDAAYLQEVEAIRAKHRSSVLSIRNRLIIERFSDRPIADITELPGIAKGTARLLRDNGIRNLADMYRCRNDLARIDGVGEGRAKTLANWLEREVLLEEKAFTNDLPPEPALPERPTHSLPSPQSHHLPERILSAVFADDRWATCGRALGVTTAKAIAAAQVVDETWNYEMYISLGSEAFNQGRTRAMLEAIRKSRCGPARRNARLCLAMIEGTSVASFQDAPEDLLKTYAKVIDHAIKYGELPSSGR